MKFSPIFFALAALLFVGAAEATPPLHGQASAPPTISQVVPSSVIVGGSQFLITVTAGNLRQGAIVRWNGAALPTHRVSMWQLTAIVPASDIAAVGTVSITVTDAAGASPAVTFTILNPVPTLTGIQPASITAGMLTVQGSHFVSSSVILLNGVSMPTTFVNAGTLKTNVPQSMIVAGQPASIRVFSPAPGGGSSNILQVVGVNPPPVLTGVSPGSFALWQAGGTLAVTGQDFVSGAVVYWGGQPLATTFQSTTSLSAVVPASLLAGPTLSTAAITVVNPGPGGGSSSALTVSEINPAPVLISVFPNTLYVYATGPALLSIAGTGFVPGATVYWNGTVLSTTYISQTAISAIVPTSFFTGPPSGNPVVTVANPSPNAGVSNGFPITETCNAPVSWITTLDFTAGSPDQSIQLQFTGIVPAASLSVQWNGSPLAIQSVSSNSFSTTVTALVPAADLLSGGPAQVTITDGCGSSTPITVNITIPTPTLSSASPDAAFGVVGGGGLTVTLTGSNFLPSVTVSVDGNPRTTTYVSATQAQITLTAADVAAVGAHAFTAINGGAGAKASLAYYYTVGYSVDQLNQYAFDLAWDATHQVLYASVPYWSQVNADSLLTIDPTSGQITSVLPVSSPADILAISDDDSYLYVGFGQLPGDKPNPPTIQRYSLPGLVPDISWTVGSENNFAQAISVAPGAAHTVSVIRAETGDVLVYDDGVARPDTWSRILYDFPNANGGIAWSPDGSALYIGDSQYTNSLFKLGVSSSGVALDTTYSGILPQDWTILGLHFDAETGYVFTDDGVVINPTSGAVVTKLTLPGTSQMAEGIVLDDAEGKVYMTYPSSTPGGGGGIYIVSYDLTTLAPVDTAFIFTYYPTAYTRITRWGAHGLALLEGFGTIVILQGDFVK